MDGLSAVKAGSKPRGLRRLQLSARYCKVNPATASVLGSADAVLSNSCNCVELRDAIDQYKKKDTSLPPIRLRRQPTRLPTFAGAIRNSCRYRFPSGQDIGTAAVLAGGASPKCDLGKSEPSPACERLRPRVGQCMSQKRRLRHRRAARTSISQELLEIVAEPEPDRLEGRMQVDKRVVGWGTAVARAVAGSDKRLPKTGPNRCSGTRAAA